jgi:hypothetical protein
MARTCWLCSTEGFHSEEVVPAEDNKEELAETSPQPQGKTVHVARTAETEDTRSVSVRARCCLLISASVGSAVSLVVWQADVQIETNNKEELNVNPDDHHSGRSKTLPMIQQDLGSAWSLMRIRPTLRSSASIRRSRKGHFLSLEA